MLRWILYSELLLKTQKCSASVHIILCTFGLGLSVSNKGKRFCSRYFKLKCASCFAATVWGRSCSWGQVHKDMVSPIWCGTGAQTQHLITRPYQGWPSVVLLWLNGSNFLRPVSKVWWEVLKNSGGFPQLIKAHSYGMTFCTVTEHVGNLWHKETIWIRQTREPQSLLFLTPICPSSADTPPAEPLLHLWRSRVYDESPNYQTGTGNSLPAKQKQQKKSHLSAESRGVTQDIEPSHRHEHDFTF